MALGGVHQDIGPRPDLGDPRQNVKTEHQGGGGADAHPFGIHPLFPGQPGKGQGALLAGDELLAAVLGGLGVIAVALVGKDACKFHVGAGPDRLQ